MPCSKQICTNVTGELRCMMAGSYRTSTQQCLEFSCILYIRHFHIIIPDQQEKAVQYSVLVKFRERLAECLSNEPTTIARDLFSTGFITERVLHKTNELNEIKADKADRLCSSVLDVIKKSPRELDEFLSVLQRPARQKLYEELVQDLKSALNQ